MSLQDQVHQLLLAVGEGQQISRSAYDTAWVARLMGLKEPIGEAALEWLRKNQQPDGSWGSKQPRYYHERLVATLAAVIALRRYGHHSDRGRLERGRQILETLPRGLKADPAGETIGFEMIVPTLVAEAESLGLVQYRFDDRLHHLTQYRAAKLAVLSGKKIDRSVTVAFSAEMVGVEGLHLLDVANLREANGSVAYSPAATTFFALNVARQDAAALAYLRRVMVDGAVPYIAPIEVFEQAWALWNLALLRPLDRTVLTLVGPHLDRLEQEWKPARGIAACAGLTLIESDTTSMVFKVLRQFQRSVDLDAVLHYEEKSHFRCFQLEANPSLSANIHVLDALREAGLTPQHSAVQKVLRFLKRTQTLRAFWFDKWHASPYYPTAHAIIACAGYDDDLIDDAVYWMLATQNSAGSWGYYMPTAEETANCLLALVMWRRAGHPVPVDVLKRGAKWLADHAERPYPPLWIGKCLYSPELVVHSAVLTALLLVESEVGA